MGVLGLWKLLEPCGKPVPLESLEDKVLAVDVSIWLNQVLKGYRDGQNGTLPNAHLMGVFHRVCKLLTYRIKPVFVFDGGVPPLKQQTLAARRLKKASASQAADRTSQKLVQNLLRQEAMRAVLGAAAPLPLAVGTASRPDPFALPPAPPTAQGASADSESDTDSSDSEADVLVDRLQFDLHSFDFESDEFRNLAPQVKHDILSDLKDTRKQNSWGKLDQMPKDADNFSEFQMGRLLKRKKFQDSMDDVEAEITKRNTELLHMGIDLPGTVTAHSMASRAGTFLVLSQPGASAAEKHNSDGAGGGGDGGAGDGAKVKTEAEAEDDDGDEGAMVEAADMMEYLAGTDLFGGGGTSGGGSAARVDRRIDELKRARRGAGAGAAAGSGSRRPAAETEADTAQVFSEMGKKYSNLYLKFSAQWLEDEKKADGKVKKESPQKRKAPEPPKNPPPSKKQTSKPEYARIPTLEEVTRDLAKIADARKKSRTGQFKKPSAPAPRHASKSAKSSRTKSSKDSPSTGSSTTPSSPGVLTVSINPAGVLPKDDLFGDVFTASAADSDDVTASADENDITAFAADSDDVGVMSDDVGVMSDSEESDEDATEGASKESPKGTPESGDKVVPGAAVRSFGAAVKERSEVADDIGVRVTGGVTGGANGTSEKRKHTETRSRDDASGPVSSSKPAPVGKDTSSVSTPRIHPDLSPADAKPASPVSAPPPSTTQSSASADLRRPSPSSLPPSFLAGDDEEDPDDPDVPSTSGGRTASPLVLPVSPRRIDPDVAAAASAATAAAASAGKEGEKEEDLPDSVWDGLDDADLPDPATATTTTASASSSAAATVATTTTAASAATASEEPPDSVWDGLDDSELRGLAEELAREQMNLLEERGRQQRDAAGVSDDMYRDVQALLEQFGIPYVVAPKEAEAQCAFLEIAGLTEGTITDDSDIWLFGGRRVYKNFFNQKKFVECYQAGDIQGSLGLTRGQLVCVALLTGSDYTLGVESVGCVRALEILAEFPGEGLSGLHAFRRWWEATRAGTSAAGTPIRRSLAALKLTHGFPSEAVQSAYLEPEVDTSREPFSWATPDLDGLRHLAAGKFGWGGAHTETVLTPVLDRLKQKQGQRRLDSFFSPAYRRDAPVEGSRRLQEAVRKVRGDDPPPPPPPAPRTGVARVAAAAAESESESARLEALMDDGLDELLAAVEEPDDEDDVEQDVEQDADVDADVDDARPSSAVDWDVPDGLGSVDAGETDSQEASSAGSSALPDVVPRRRAAPRVSRGGGVRGGSRGRGRGRARSSTITSTTTVPDSTHGPPASQRSGGSSRPAPVPAELAALDPVSRERVLLVRRLRDRANLVRAQIQQEDGPPRRPAVQRPSTRQVRAKMMETLLKHNPRLKLEREAEMRRRLGLPPMPVGRGRSCRDPAARREQNFADVLTAPDQQRPGEGSAAAAEAVEAAAEGSQDSATAPSEAVVTAEGSAPATGQSRDPTPADASVNAVASPAAAPAATMPSAPSVAVQTAAGGRQTDSAVSGSAAVTTGETASPVRPAAGRGRRASDAAPARRQSAADRLRQASAASERPLPVLPAPAAAEEPPQKLMSERRQAEARRHAAELLRAAGGAASGRRKRAGGAAAGRRQRPVQRPAPGPRAGGLSESSDSD